MADVILLTNMGCFCEAKEERERERGMCLCIVRSIILLEIVGICMLL